MYLQMFYSRNKRLAANIGTADGKTLYVSMSMSGFIQHLTKTIQTRQVVSANNVSAASLYWLKAQKYLSVCHVKAQ